MTLHGENKHYPEGSGVPRILVLGGDASEAGLISARLAQRGMPCEVVQVDSTEALRTSLREGDVDVVVVDQVLLDSGGFDVAGEFGSDAILVTRSGAPGKEIGNGAAAVSASGPDMLLAAIIRVLRGADEDYRAMFEFDPVGRIFADPYTGAILRVNPKMCEITGYSEVELLGMTLANLTHPEDAPLGGEHFLTPARPESSGFSSEQRFVRNGGEVIRVSVDAAPAGGGSGPVWGVVASIKQIAGGKDAEDETIRLASLASSSPIPMIETSSAGRPTFANPAARQRFPNLATMGARHPILAGPAPVAAQIDEAGGGGVYTNEVSVDGLLYERLMLAVPGDDVLRLYATDITERRRAEEALKRSEQRFRSLVRYASDIIMIVDDEGLILYESPAVERVLGFRPEERTGLNIFSQVHPDDLAMARERFAEIVESPDLRLSVELRFRDSEGGWRSFEAVGTNLLQDPVIKGIVVNARDVTESRRAEGALRNSEERFKWTLEQATENIFVVNPESKEILDANTTVQRTLGYSLEELKGMTLYDIAANDQDDRDLTSGPIVAGEKKYRHKNGSLTDVEVAIPYSDDQAVCIVARDITERKRTETALRQNLSVLLALREAGQVLSSTLESEEIGTRLLEIMRSVAGLTATVVTRYDQDGNLRIWRSAGLGDLWPRVRFTKEAENARLAALRNEAQKPFRLLRPGSEDEYLAGLCLPLRVRNRTIGVLEAYGKTSLGDGDMVQIVSSLATQAASALENARLYEELGRRERTLQDLVTRLLGAQEEERRRVAYEVHDGLAQVAVAAHQNLQAFARRYPPESEQGRRELGTVLTQVRATVSDARKVIANLRPTALDDLGLAAAISLEVERLNDEGYYVDYDERLGNERLPKEMEITIFRVVQEALTNVRKHADTRRVRIELTRRNGEICLAVQDFGSGFDLTALETLGRGPGERVGFAGMRERVNMLGGEFEVKSHHGAGTLITANIPLERARG